MIGNIMLRQVMINIKELVSIPESSVSLKDFQNLQIFVVETKLSYYSWPITALIGYFHDCMLSSIGARC